MTVSGLDALHTSSVKSLAAVSGEHSDAAQYSHVSVHRCGGPRRVSISDRHHHAITHRRTSVSDRSSRAVQMHGLVVDLLQGALTDAIAEKPLTQPQQDISNARSATTTRRRVHFPPAQMSESLDDLFDATSSVATATVRLTIVHHVDSKDEYDRMGTPGNVMRLTGTAAEELADFCENEMVLHESAQSTGRHLVLHGNYHKVRHEIRRRLAQLKFEECLEKGAVKTHRVRPAVISNQMI